jgi:hypothetical protein
MNNVSHVFSTDPNDKTLDEVLIIILKIIAREEDD